MEDSDQSKLFVGGICWDTTDEVLKEHFGKYGTVIGCVIAKDRNTGSPRGFAFVSFSDPSAVHEALLHSHNILGRTVDVKKARPRMEPNQNQQFQNRGSSRNNNNSRSNGNSNNNFRTKKIFVGGLPHDLTDQEFRTYFEKFGRITDVVVMHDNITHRPRGFGFITFDNDDAVEIVMQTSFHELGGKSVEVKRAVPKEGNNPNSIAYNGQVGSDGTPNSNGYLGGTHPYYDPRYSVLYPGYAYGGLAGYPYGPAAFGGYPNGVYSRYGYGSSSGPWTGPAMVGFRGSPVPYSNVYSPYWSNGVGVMNVAPNGYNGFVGAGPDGKSSQFGGDLQEEDGMSVGEV